MSTNNNTKLQITLQEKRTLINEIEIREIPHSRTLNLLRTFPRKLPPALLGQRHSFGWIYSKVGELRLVVAQAMQVGLLHHLTTASRGTRRRLPGYSREALRQLRHTHLADGGRGGCGRCIPVGHCNEDEGCHRTHQQKLAA